MTLPIMWHHLHLEEQTVNANIIQAPAEIQRAKRMHTWPTLVEISYRNRGKNYRHGRDWQAPITAEMAAPVEAPRHSFLRCRFSLQCLAAQESRILASPVELPLVMTQSPLAV